MLSYKGKKRKKSTKEEIDLICNEFKSGKTILEISKEKGIPKRTIYDYMYKNGTIKKTNLPKYSLDGSIFNKITNESAYWIGLLMADGCIDDTGTIILKLKKEDINHIRKFRKFLKSNHKIKNAYVLRKNKIYMYPYMSLSSVKLSKALFSYGITPRKSFTAKACPELENNKHFWRGVIDGDGSLCYSSNKYKYPVLSLCGSKFIVSQFANYCGGILNKKINVHKTCNIYAMSLTGRPAMKIITNLYKNSNIHLNRKYKKAMKIMNNK